MIRSPRPDLRLELRSRNNVLWHAIFDRGLTVMSFCRQYGLPNTLVGQYLNLRASPYYARQYRMRAAGTLSPVAEQICAAVQLAPGVLFPPDLYGGAFPSVRVAEVSAARFLALKEAPTARLALPPVQDDEVERRELRDAIGGVLETLSPREQRVLELLFGLNGEDVHSLDEVGKVYDVSRERIRQIKEKGLRRLRHRSRSALLRPFVSD